jgi:hypothetical protein
MISDGAQPAFGSPRSFKEVAMQVSNLRIEIRGFPINVYRIDEADLEFRTLDPSGHSYPDRRSTWRRLSTNEIALHFRLNTVVGRWLGDKITGPQQQE